ncbi:hypothetical protein CAPTEDRAFT_120164, partial [Capitella teleta]
LLHRDIFPVMKNAEVFQDCISLLTEHVEHLTTPVDAIVGLDARGFIFGPLMAQRLNIPFIPVRKAGKLPGETIKYSYQLEYGSDTFEIQKSAVHCRQRVVIVDDLLATGGTMKAAAMLLKSLGAEVVECMVVIELTSLKGRDKVPAPLYSMIQYHDI